MLCGSERSTSTATKVRPARTGNRRSRPPERRSKRGSSNNTSISTREPQGRTENHRPHPVRVPRRPIPRHLMDLLQRRGNPSAPGRRSSIAMRVPLVLITKSRLLPTKTRRPRVVRSRTARPATVTESTIRPNVTDGLSTPGGEAAFIRA